MSAATADRWLELLDGFAIAQRAGRIAPGTIENRIKHVRQFAARVQLPPDQVTFEDYRGWLDRLDVTRTRRDALRTSLRAFYRWSAASGRTYSDPTAEPEYVRARHDVPDAWHAPLEAYRAYQRSIGRPSTTIRTNASQLARFARDHARLTPASITDEHITDWLGAKHWAIETRRGHRSTLGTFYQWMLDTGRVDADPTAKLPVIKRADHLPRPALDDEYAIALERADARERIALRLAAELGLRCAEVAVTHSRDLLNTTEGAVLRVHGKGSKQREIPLTDNLALMLRTLPPGYAIPGQVNGHISAHYLGKLISQLLPEGVTMHALRHRFASRAYNHSRDLLTVQQLLGHASPETTKVYVRLDHSAKRQLIEATAS